MDDTTKHRIIGGIVLAASAAIFLPIFFKNSPHTQAEIKKQEFAIPDAPKQPELTFDTNSKVSEPMEPIDELAQSAAPAVANVNSNTPAPAVAVTQALPVDVNAVNAPAKSTNPAAANLAEVTPMPAEEPTLAPVDPPLPVDAVAVKAEAAPSIPPAPVVAAAEPVPAEAPVVALTPTKAKKVSHHAVKQTAKAKIAARHEPIHHKVVHVAPAKGDWTVQVASFTSAEHADGLKQKLAASGFHAYVKLAQTQTGPISRVFIGSKVDRASAEKIKQQLLAKTHTEAIIVHTKVAEG